MLRKFNLFAFTFILFSSALLSNALYSPDSNVIILDESNFEAQVLGSEGLWLVEFYAPWCGHCKNLAPEWKKAADALKGVFNFGAVDADAYPSFKSKYEIRGFPTIKFFGLDKVPKDYTSGRSAAQLVDYAVDRIKELAKQRMQAGGETITEEPNKSENEDDKREKNTSDQKGSGADKDVHILTDDNFDAVVTNSKDLWLIEFYAPWCGHCKNLEPEWNAAATDLKGKVKLGKVDCTVHSRLAQRFQISGYPSIKLFPPGEKNDSLVEKYEGGRSSTLISEYALDRLEKFGIFPDIPQLISGEMYEEECVKAVARTCLLVFLPNLYDSRASERKEYLEVLKKASSAAKGKPMTILWAQGGDFFDYEEKLGLSFGFPAVAVVNHNKKKYGLMRSSFDLENLKTYVTRVFIGRESFYDMPPLPKMKVVSPWDGEDIAVEAEPIVNEDL